MVLHLAQLEKVARGGGALAHVQVQHHVALRV